MQNLIPRFADNPMIVGPPYIRFYASVPLHAADGKKVGTFCIKDKKPREITLQQIEILKTLAGWVEIELNMHELSKALKARKKSEEKASNLNGLLILINKILRHDILNNITVVRGNIQLYLEKEDDKERLKHSMAAIDRSKDLIDKMRNVEKAIATGKELKPINLSTAVKGIVQWFPQIQFKVKGEGIILGDEAINSVIENVIRNAILHGQTKKIDIEIEEEDEEVTMTIADYGTGIPAKIKNNLFTEGFKYGKTGNTGLGLFIIKKTVERYWATVAITDNKPQGAVFVFKFQKFKPDPKLN